jgi:hypothetical protein
MKIHKMQELLRFSMNASNLSYLVARKKEEEKESKPHVTDWRKFQYKYNTLNTMHKRKEDEAFKGIAILRQYRSVHIDRELITGG